ncbi:MAG: nickel pincer cofactor biosynthesis protein LarC [candidate division KSB1 bacterium]|nr:nickel pincer cofactor biosynthesis protein LarC [candidate division KSB1 bacterium]
MKIAYFDCFAGISGDMILGAFLDAGLDETLILELPQRLELPQVALARERVVKSGLSATRVRVECPHEHHHRHLPQIEAIIDRADIAAPAKAMSKTIFRQLAEAEARVHGVPVEKVHFHEVGAADAIIDIVGAAVAWHAMGLKAAFTGPISVGGGMVTMSHGRYPVPAPATAYLLESLPVRRGPVEAELTTPTGAAVLRAFVGEAAAEAPVFRAEATGYGAGSRDFDDFPNVLRLQIGRTEPILRSDIVHVLECNIDDMNPEFYPYIMQSLLDAGALDVYLTPVIMKKGRPGTQIAVLTPPEKDTAVLDILFSQTSTIGVRRYVAERRKLPRETIEAETRFGNVRCKQITLPDGRIRRVPEYESCREIAEEQGLPLKEVYDYIRADLETGKVDAGA